MRKPAAFRTGNQWWKAAGFACWHLRSVRCCLRHQRLFFALVERLLVVLLLVRLEVWFLQLVLRFSLRFSMV